MPAAEELIRKGYDAWNRGDWPAMESMLAPEFEVDATERVLNPDTYHGIEGFRRLATEMDEIWDSWEVEAVDELIENGDRVFAPHRVRARGKGSGIEIDRVYWSVWTIRDGKGVKLALFMDRDRALSAAGLDDGG